MTVRFPHGMGDQKDGPAARVRLPAVIDEHAADALRTELYTLLTGSTIEHIELDARELRLISPRGLGVLASVGLAVRRRGAQLDVVHCSPRLLSALRIARLAGSPGGDREGSSADPGVDLDWTPWWSSAAANA